MTLSDFRTITLIDFEFSAPDGERPVPICLVAHEVHTGQTLRVWEDQLRRSTCPPYPTGPDSLVVAYYASAEIGCHLALDWPVPCAVLDLFTEFRNLTNGRPPPGGAGLLGALALAGTAH